LSDSGLISERKAVQKSGKVEYPVRMPMREVNSSETSLFIEIQCCTMAVAK
jgi:hypothetical protein